jgi:hypothetical protein
MVRIIVINNLWRNGLFYKLSKPRHALKQADELPIYFALVTPALHSLEIYAVLAASH